MPMPADPSLTRLLRALLHGPRTAALGSLTDDGLPQVSMLPFAVVTSQACLAVHVSGLAAHTRHLASRPRASLMVAAAEMPGQPVHALPRCTLDVQAVFVEAGTPLARACRTAYLKRFPEAEPMTHFADFRFVALTPLGGRHIAGFGAARNVGADELARVLRARPRAPKRPPAP